MPTQELVLTPENYYDKDTDFQYMSFSIFKNFLQNEAAALADLKGEYKWFDNDTALLVGNYLHSYFESPQAHRKFIVEHPELISTRGATKGELKREYAICEKMIARLEADDLFTSLLAGTERETIITGEIDGIKWKGKTDALNIEKGYFIDFKTVKDLNGDCEIWENGTRSHFIHARKYDMQMAIYRELLKQTYGKEFQPIIWAVSKEETPIARAFAPEEFSMQMALEQVKDKQQRVKAIINGEIKPKLTADDSRYYKENFRVSQIEVV